MNELRVRRKGTEKALDLVSDANPFPVAVTETATAPSVSELLGDILLQLRIQNAHLALVTGEAINEEDLDVTN